MEAEECKLRLLSKPTSQANEANVGSHIPHPEQWQKESRFTKQRDVLQASEKGGINVQDGTSTYAVATAKNNKRSEL